MKKNLIRIISAALVVIMILSCFAGCKKEENFEKVDPSTTAPETTTEALPTNLNPLTGEELEESAIGKRVVAIMVENTPAARPQWGLSTPDVVVEGLVEGGITRMMWLYADYNKIPKIGPIRSARHDYVELAYGMNAIYVHWGGSTQAYNLLKNLGYDDIDGMKWGNKYFFKDKTRNTATEHRGYSNGEYLIGAMESAGTKTEQTKKDWAPFSVLAKDRVPFGDASESGDCNSITLTFSSSYKHTFKYNADDGLYYNYMNVKEMKDGNNDQTMAVKNVLVMYCSTETIAGDKKGRQDWSMKEGTGLYISNGKGEKITWKKGAAEDPLRFYGQDGQLLTINKGQSWIGIVPAKNSQLTTVD